MAPIKSPEAAFAKAFGKGVSYRKYTSGDDDRLRERVPAVFRDIVKGDGWCSYREEVLWTCDPDDWAPVARAWFKDTARAQILARTAFGDLLVWDEEWCWFVLVHHSRARQWSDDPAWFFARGITSSDFATQTHLPARVRSAKAVAGPLAWDEMYTYVPALGLGGDEATSEIERVKAREQLVFLSQVAPILRS
jgi:hypothetical protein